MFEGKLDENVMIDAYSSYLQKNLRSNSRKGSSNTLMAYEEYKEFYILSLLGRASEFSNNIARDFQYMSLDIYSQLPA